MRGDDQSILPRIDEEFRTLVININPLELSFDGRTAEIVDDRQEGIFDSGSNTFTLHRICRFARNTYGEYFYFVSDLSQACSSFKCEDCTRFEVSRAVIKTDVSTGDQSTAPASALNGGRKRSAPSSYRRVQPSVTGCKLQFNGSERCFVLIALCTCILFFVTPTWADSACAGKMVNGKRSDGRSYPITLSSAWSDERILQALKLNVGDAKVTTAIGPDGFATFYEFSDAKVSIGHSVNDGLTVTFSKAGDSIIWDLDLCVPSGT